MVAELFAACTAGAVLTAWALYLELGPLRIALLAALPHLGQVVQMPAAWLTASRGCRRVALVSVCAARLVFLPLALLPWLPIGLAARQNLLLSVAAVSALLAVVANNAWVAWMGDLVPHRVRGRYFGKRTALCALAGGGAAVFGGAALDVARSFHVLPWVLSGLAGMACIAGGVTTVLMKRQHAVAPVEKTRFQLRALALPYWNPRLRPLLAYQILWNASTGLASAFYALHMLQNLKLGFLLVALYNGGVQGMRILSAPFWGRVLDRFGARPVLLACTAGLTPLPLLWLLPAELRIPMLAIDLLLYGFLWAGHGLAVFHLPLSLTRREERPYGYAAIAVTGGLAFALASAVGGLALRHLPETFTLGHARFVHFQALFAFSAGVRLAAVFMGRRLLEPRSHGTEVVLRHVGATALQRLGGARLTAGLVRR